MSLFGYVMYREWCIVCIYLLLIGKQYKLVLVTMAKDSNRRINRERRGVVAEEAVHAGRARVVLSPMLAGVHLGRMLISDWVCVCAGRPAAFR